MASEEEDAATVAAIWAEAFPAVATKVGSAASASSAGKVYAASETRVEVEADAGLAAGSASVAGCSNWRRAAIAHGLTEQLG